MKEIFDFSKNSAYELRCVNCLSRSNIHSTHFGIEAIANITAKIWNKIPNVIKEASSITVFKSKIRKRVPLQTLQNICGISVFYIINNSLVSIHNSLVSIHNSLVSIHNSLVSIHNSLVSI